MSVRRDPRNGKWYFRKVVKLPDGRKERLFGVPAINTKPAAEDAERKEIERVLKTGEVKPVVKEVMTFTEWFEGRFWEERLVENSPGELKNKRGIFEKHLRGRIGALPLDQIRKGELAKLRAALVGSKTVTTKTINNILVVVSTALNYAVDTEVIDKAPKIGLLRYEGPEIEWWSFEEYARILAAARDESPEWFAGICLAGEAGLRVGEVKALRWREDVDLIASTLTVNESRRQELTGPPKGRRRRTVPLTSTLLSALKALEVVRTGYVIRNLDGTPMTDRQAYRALLRVLRRAGLPERERPWHALRHTFGTHLAMLGVNPWRLQAWLGHRDIKVTHHYVHVAQSHARPIPPAVQAAGNQEVDPERRVLAQLSARVLAGPDLERRGSAVAAEGGDFLKLLES